MIMRISRLQTLRDVLILVNVAERSREKNPVLADSLPGSTNKRAYEQSFFRKWDVGVWTGSSCLRIGTGGGHL